MIQVKAAQEAALAASTRAEELAALLASKTTTSTSTSTSKITAEDKQVGFTIYGTNRMMQTYILITCATPNTHSYLFLFNAPCGDHLPCYDHSIIKELADLQSQLAKAEKKGDDKLAATLTKKITKLQPYDDDHRWHTNDDYPTATADGNDDKVPLKNDDYVPTQPPAKNPLDDDAAGTLADLQAQLAKAEKKGDDSLVAKLEKKIVKAEALVAVAAPTSYLEVTNTPFPPPPPPSPSLPLTLPASLVLHLTHHLTYYLTPHPLIHPLHTFCRFYKRNCPPPKRRATRT